MKQRSMILVAVGVAIAACLGYSAREADGGKAKVETRVFEMRTYYIHPGRMKAMT